MNLAALRTLRTVIGMRGRVSYEGLDFRVIWDWYVMDDFEFKTDLGVEEEDFSHKVKNSYLPLLLIIMVIIIVTVSE